MKQTAIVRCVEYSFFCSFWMVFKQKLEVEPFIHKLTQPETLQYMNKLNFSSLILNSQLSRADLAFLAFLESQPEHTIHGSQSHIAFCIKTYFKFKITRETINQSIKKLARIGIIETINVEGSGKPPKIIKIKGAQNG